MSPSVMTYQIHRLKAHLRQNFRFAPHVSGVTNVKPRDFEAAGTVEATSPYAAFFAMKDSEQPLEVGDILESNGSLRILKFVGFEEAQWVLPEAKPPVTVEAEASSAAIQ